MTMNKQSNRVQHGQQGFALITAMLVLIVVTIITVTAVRNTALEEMMAGNLRNQNIAFQSAESALREAEALIRSEGLLLDWDGDGESKEVNPFNPLKLSNGPFQTTSCVSGVCGTTSPLQSSKITTLGSNEVRAASTGITGITEPEYVIELIRTDPSTDSGRVYAIFRVTARAWGEDPNSFVQLQSTYRSHALSFVH